MTDEDVERVAVSILHAAGSNFKHYTPQNRALIMSAARAALISNTPVWRPIESAPKEGKFLIAGNGKMMIADGWILQKAIQPHTPYHLSLNWAKYWQPLPQPPESSDE